MSFLDESNTLYIRNALRRAAKTSRITFGPCGTYKACRGGTGGVCVFCAILLSRNEDRHVCSNDNPSLSEHVAEILGVDHDWMIGLSSGFDGESNPDNGNEDAFRLGRKLAKEFKKEDDQ